MPQDFLDKAAAAASTTTTTTMGPSTIVAGTTKAPSNVARLTVSALSFAGLDKVHDRRDSSMDAFSLPDVLEESSLPGSVASSEETTSNNEMEVASVASSDCLLLDEDHPASSLLLMESNNTHTRNQHLEFTALRLTYLVVTLVIMLADGLQGKKQQMVYNTYIIMKIHCQQMVSHALSF